MSEGRPVSFVIAISGTSGAGKTTLVQKVTERLGNAVALHFDDYSSVSQYPLDARAWVDSGGYPDDWRTAQRTADRDPKGRQRMDTDEVIGLICTPETFRPVGHEEVRWLDRDDDLALYQESFFTSIGAEPPSRDDWEDWHTQGYRYCGLVRGQMIVARAAVWAYSERAWELAAVLTQPEHRGRGYSKSVCSFATTHILAAGRTATCHTRNPAMIRVAKSLGYGRCSTRDTTS